MTTISELGGFLPSPRTITPITSPAPSNASFGSSSSDALPKPRPHALRPGSKKEEAARRYIEGRLLAVSRRFVKKFQDAQPGELIIGYTRFSDVCKDLSEILNIIWLSGTPSLQVPYLLNIALSTSDYLTAFPPAPKATFALLRKLDYAFSSLLRGVDAETGRDLPGLEKGRLGLSKTDIVRMKGIVENTRNGVVKLMDSEHLEEEEVEGDELDYGHDATNDSDDDDDDDDMDGDGYKAEENDNTGMLDLETPLQLDLDEGENDMDIARVYERTIVAINQTLASEIDLETGG